MFRGNMVLLADTKKNLQYNLTLLEEELRQINMNIKIEKTKTMIISNKTKSDVVCLDKKRIKQVEYFQYLGAIIKENERLDGETGQNVKCVQQNKDHILGKKESIEENKS